MVANTAMDTDKIKIYGARVKVDSLSKVAAIEQACSQCTNQIVAARLRHGSMMTSTPSTRRRLDGVAINSTPSTRRVVVAPASSRGQKKTTSKLLL